MTERLEARALARARIRGIRSRVALLRRRAVAFAIATFIVAWGLIFVRMVSGHDPVLSGSSTATASTGKTDSGQSGQSDATPSQKPRTVRRVVPVPVAGGGYAYQVVRVPVGSQGAGSTSSGSTQQSPAPSSSPAPVVTSTS